MSRQFMKIRSGINLPALASAPSDPQDGDLYYDSTLGRLRFYNVSQWEDVGGGGGGVSVVTPGAYPHSAASGTIILVDTSAARTINLPAPTVDSFITIKDAAGLAGTNNITVARNASEQIEGLAANYKIEADWASVSFAANGTNWFIV